MNVKNIVSFAKRIEENNKAYKKLTQAEKRVAVAKDAIAQLLLGSFNASPGVYVRAKGVDKVEALCGIDVPQCEVCAIGSLLVSSFRVAGDQNVLTAGSNDPWRGTNPRVSANYDTGSGSVAAFTEPMLRRMEATFEGSICSWDTFENLADIDTDYPVDELRFVLDADARLFAILENVIENGGTFKPAVVRTQADWDNAVKKGEKTKKRFLDARTKARKYSGTTVAAT